MTEFGMGDSVAGASGVGEYVVGEYVPSVGE